jgi:hypothetical protein
MELQTGGWSCARHAGWSCACVPLVWPTWHHCQCCTLLVCRTRSELRSRWAIYTSKSVNFWMNSTKYTLIKPLFPEWICATFTSTKPCKIRRFKLHAFYSKTKRRNSLTMVKFPSTQQCKIIIHSVDVQCYYCNMFRS